VPEGDDEGVQELLLEKVLDDDFSRKPECSSVVAGAVSQSCGLDGQQSQTTRARALQALIFH
jgi:hypothetical protein